ncbi:MAG: adenylyl-sulfate kinase [Nitrosomonadales bacterium]|nr:adenylyl-sulfate kinase [Nitrosomonadales bacterium]
MRAPLRCFVGGYANARKGHIADSTGVETLYEAPVAPQVRVSPLGREPEACVEQIAKRVNLFDDLSAVNL